MLDSLRETFGESRCRSVGHLMTISEQIESDLRAHVVAGEEPPYPLTLGGIAKFFEVSLMPVRGAVDSLVADNFLLRGENGRLSINPRRRRRDGAKLNKQVRGKRPDAPEKLLTDYVIDLSLQGADECLREEVTAERFGIGRTVLRRILNRLAGEGIIEHLPRRGWRVRPFREKDMLDYIDMRETLELHALDLACGNLDEGHLKELLEGNTPGKGGKPRLDNRLHRYFVDSAGNRYLGGFFDQNGIYFEALFTRAVLDEETVARRAKEHRVILKALLDGDIQKAKQSLSLHIRDQKDHVGRLFEVMVGTN